MKKTLIFLISFYQLAIASFLKSITGNPKCKFETSCSDYAKEMITKYGAFEGGIRSFKRIASCQNFITYGKYI